MHRNNKKSPRPVFLLLLIILTAATVVTSPTGYYLARSAVVRSADPSDALSCTGQEALMFSPGGMSFGVRLSTKGVLVVGFARGDKGSSCPAEEAGLSVKDVIEKINGQAVNTASQVISQIENCGGKAVTLSVDRNGEKMTLSFVPTKDESGIYRAGIWVRDSTAGIGTVTMVDPKTGYFFGLGHGICDTDTGALMPLLKGNVYDISVVAVRKGKAGAPGELKGYFSSSLVGILLKNTPSGVYGRYQSVEAAELSTPMPLARRNEVKVGNASIYCTLTDGKIREYSVCITKITSPDGSAKNFVIEVTDPLLLEETGGIVQGMSGSPIIQNGKIVGAVTHVMVGDPTRGYGIFIDNMLAQMGDLTE